MKFTFLNGILAGLMLSVSNFASAGIIDQNSVLLNDTSASQLENWLGQGDLDWTSIWFGATGATSTSWHSAVDGVANTVSIYNITYAGQEFLIGGYNAHAWNSTTGSTHDFDGVWENFIFNLTTNIKAQTTIPHNDWAIGRHAVYNDESDFARFGGGFEIYAGNDKLGDDLGYAGHLGTYVGRENTGTGNIVNGDKTAGVEYIVNSMETFTFSAATSVPEPSTLAIFALGIMGLATRRFKKAS